MMTKRRFSTATILDALVLAGKIHPNDQDYVQFTNFPGMGLTLLVEVPELPAARVVHGGSHDLGDQQRTAQHAPERQYDGRKTEDRRYLEESRAPRYADESPQPRYADDTPPTHIRRASTSSPPDERSVVGVGGGAVQRPATMRRPEGYPTDELPAAEPMVQPGDVPDDVTRRTIGTLPLPRDRRPSLTVDHDPIQRHHPQPALPPEDRDAPRPAQVVQESAPRRVLSPVPRGFAGEGKPWTDPGYPENERPGRRASEASEIGQASGLPPLE